MYSYDLLTTCNRVPPSCRASGQDRGNGVPRAWLKKRGRSGRPNLLHDFQRFPARRMADCSPVMGDCSGKDARRSEASAAPRPEPPPAGVPLRPPEASLAPAERPWSASAEGAVRLRTEESGPAADAPRTVHQMFLETAEAFGERPAVARKEDGRWQTLTWRQYYRECRTAAKSFIKLGLERYHGVGILGFNAPEWFIANVGCILAGGLATGIYTTNLPEACWEVASSARANVIVVEDQQQMDKILQVKDRLQHLKAIVQYKGELKQRLASLYTWAEFMRLGEDVPEQELNESIARLRANQCCSLIFTSGATGTPKAVMLSHDNVTWTAQRAGEAVDLRYGEESVVSYLPLSHVAAQLNDLYITMRFAATTYFAQADALKGSLVATLKEVRPTSFLGVPRVWEKMQEKMQAAGAKASPFKKSVADWSKAIGLMYNYSAMHKEKRVPWGFTLANQLVFKKVRAALGLDRCRILFTGSAPISKETLEYFMSLNMPLMELYGMSESSGPHTISTNDDFHISSCGKVMAGCKVKLDKQDEEGNGEICFWGRNVFMGYLNMEDKTKEALDQDGWLHSGDVGRFQRNFLFITGRIKELIITAGGENVAPVPIEDAVKAEVPIVSNAMLIGDRKKFLSMLVTLKCVADQDGRPTDRLSPDVVGFCRDRGLRAATVSEVVAGEEPAVYEAIWEGVRRYNDAKAVSNAQKVQKFVVLPRDFSVAGGELGPTMKLRRPIVVQMYQEKIDELYAEQTQPK